MQPIFPQLFWFRPGLDCFHGLLAASEEGQRSLAQPQSLVQFLGGSFINRTAEQLFNPPVAWLSDCLPCRQRLNKNQLFYSEDDNKLFSSQNLANSCATKSCLSTIVPNTGKLVRAKAKFVSIGSSSLRLRLGGTLSGPVSRCQWPTYCEFMSKQGQP